MTLADLRERIRRREALLGVVGLGYVGLPVAVVFAEAGFDVLGMDIDADRVAKINAGVSPIEGQEPGLAEILAQVVRTGRLRATTEYDALRDRDVVIVAVHTPVDEEKVPRYDALKTALIHLGPVLKNGTLVIVESTIAPRTTEELIRPLLEQSSGKRANEGFHLGHCPERVTPGRLLHNLRAMSRVVGGLTPETTETMADLYRHVVQVDLDLTDCLTAELVKTVENAYRDVQIAFANEVSLICEAVGGDVWRVRELVNKVPARNMHLPGAGVGGHCIPKDPWLLAYSVRDKEVPLRLIPAARAVNDSMPLHVADITVGALREAGVGIAGANVAVLGYAYLENSDDTRNSPSEALVARLQELGACIRVHDTYVPEYRGDLWQIVEGCDALVVMVAHDAYRTLDLRMLRARVARPILIDGRHVFSAEQARAAGWIYRGIGQG